MKTDDIQRISQITLNHYRQSAEAFWLGTKDHDVSQNRQALLSALDTVFNLKHYHILDFGCGPGRDLVAFKALGHQVTGLDGCEAFTAHAQKLSDCPVWTQDFHHLELPDKQFHGVFANASFFQLPSHVMPKILTQIKHTLKKDGVLFMSNPRGKGEGLFGDRYATYLELEGYTALLEGAGFVLKQYYYRPQGLPREQQPWLALVAFFISHS